MESTIKRLDDVDEFYDSISKSYTESIRRCVPHYNEMLKSLFIYLKPDRIKNYCKVELYGSSKSHKGETLTCLSADRVRKVLTRPL